MHEATGENNNLKDVEKNELLSSYIKYFENVMLEIFRSSINKSTVNLKDHELRVLVLSILTYSEQLSQVILLLSINNCIFIRVI